MDHTSGVSSDILHTNYHLNLHQLQGNVLAQKRITVY